MATLLIEDIDDRLYSALCARAAANCRSVGEEVEAMIRAALTLRRPPREPRQITQELLALTGSWQDDRPAEQIASEIRESRRMDHRFGEDIVFPKSLAWQPYRQSRASGIDSFDGT